MRAGPQNDWTAIYREAGSSASKASLRASGTRLCVDGRMLGPGGTGISTYARAVASAQLWLEETAMVLDAGPAGSRRGYPARLVRYLCSALPFQRRAVVVSPERMIASDLFRIAQIHFDIYGTMLTVHPPVRGGIMHWTYPLPIRLSGWRNVYTLHDAIPITHPDLTPINSRRHAALLQHIVASADGLLTVSDAARSDLASALGIEAGRIVNCSQPADVALHSGPPPAGLAARGYLLVVGSVEPRKNVAATLRAYVSSGVDLPLVVAGPAAAGAQALEALVTATPGAIRLPYLDRTELEALLTGARALLMPSLAEGFGLPVAEAMSLGIPVVTSDRGALAETAGNCAITVDPGNRLALAEAIRTISTDDAVWTRLADAGRRNAKRFTADCFAARLGRYYAELIAGPDADL